MLGAKDDIVELSHNKKFIGQFIAALIITYFADVRLTSMYGVLGISELPYWASLAFSTVTIVFIINAFNLIDGINWLASGVALIITISFGVWFFAHGFHEYAIMSAATSGAILSFMRFNYTPAKIFMGDSGSLSIGLISAVLAIVFIEKSYSVIYSSANMPFHVKTGPALAIAVMIIPIFDTLRAFSLRILKGKSPFVADRNHIHHRLVDLGFSHIQSSLILMSTNLAFIIITYNLQFIRNAILIPLIFLAATIMAGILFSFRIPDAERPKKDNKKQLAIPKTQIKTKSVSPT
jgi:UDP-N-acetylmuramyl pentapeptide phosphotransferase/UDP-N-acetylglucosamine-1-phosphate transferase